MVAAESLSFDLVVATVGRAGELETFLTSLERQTHTRFTVLVVDQNDDDRIVPLVAAHPGLTIAHLRSRPGLSHARNVALESVSGDIVAFPDDDCIYADDLLGRLASRFAAHPGLAGLTGRGVAGDGSSSASWKTDGAVLTRTNLWNRAISYTTFLRREVVSRVGRFDEQLGLGSGAPWHSGEEIDYLIRAVDRGFRIEYDPSLVVEHDTRENDAATGLRDGASVGFILGKHRYPMGVLARMLVRPMGGVVQSIVRRDPASARFHAATLRGRVRGYRGARRSKIAA